MIEEAIARIQELADEAKEPKVVRLPGEPQHIYHIIYPSGRVERHEAEPGPRKFYIDNIDDLIAMARSPFDPRIDDARQVIMLNSALDTGGTSEVALFFNSVNLRETAILPLPWTDELVFMFGQRGRPAISVHDLRMALTSTLMDTFAESGLVGQISRLDFTNEDRAQVASERGRESMGRSIDQQVSGELELPDQLQTFQVRPFANPDLSVRFPLRVQLEPDPQTRQWWFKPVESSWLEFEGRVGHWVRNVIREGLGDDCPARVFQGSAIRSEGHGPAGVQSVSFSGKQ